MILRVRLPFCTFLRPKKIPRGTKDLIKLAPTTPAKDPPRRRDLDFDFAIIKS